MTGDTGGQHHRSTSPAGGTRCRPSLPPGCTTDRRRTAGDRAARVRFRRAIALMLMTLVLPGSAQLVAGNRKVGRIAMRIWFVLVAGTLVAALVGLVWHGFAFRLGTDTFVLGLLRAVLMVLAVGWAALFIDAWRIGQPLTLALPHRRAVVGVNGAALPLGRRDPALRRAPGRRTARLHHHHVRRRRGDRRPRRPLQRAAARRRLRRRPLGPAPGLDDRRQHRRGHRPDRADRAAPQHGELPVRQGLGDARAVPGRVRLRGLLPQRRQHLGRRQHRAVRQLRRPRASTPRSRRSRGSPG